MGRQVVHIYLKSIPEAVEFCALLSGENKRVFLSYDLYTIDAKKLACVIDVAINRACEIRYDGCIDDELYDKIKKFEI